MFQSKVPELKDILAKSIFDKILTECPSKDFGKLFSNYPNIPEKNSKINQDTMDQLVKLIEKKADEFNERGLPEKERKQKFEKCLIELGFPKDNIKYLYSEIIFNGFKNMKLDKIEEFEKFNDLAKAFCRRLYLKMINVRKYNRDIFKDEHLNLKEKFIKIMKFLGILEPEYLNMENINKNIIKALENGLTNIDYIDLFDENINNDEIIDELLKYMSKQDVNELIDKYKTGSEYTNEDLDSMFSEEFNQKQKNDFMASINHKKKIYEKLLKFKDA